MPIVPFEFISVKMLDEFKLMVLSEVLLTVNISLRPALLDAFMSIQSIFPFSLFPNT